MEKWKLYLKILVNFLLFFVTILLVGIFLPKAIRFFLPVIIGFIVAMIANPLVKFLEQKVKLVRRLSSVLLIILTIVGVIAGLYGIISFIAKEIIDLFQDLPFIIEQIYENTKELQEKYHLILEFLPKSVNKDSGTEDIKNITISIRDSISSYFTIDNASSIAKNIGDVTFLSILSILFAYFFITERESIIRNIKKVIPQSIIKYTSYILDGFKVAVGGYIKAQFKIMVIMVLILFIGLEILQANYSFLIAIGIALLDILPLFGTGFILWPWALTDLLLGDYFSAVGLIVIYVLCQIIKQILQPKLVGDSVGMSPFATLIFMFIGYQISGIFGMIIGIPFGMIVINLYKMGLFERLIRGLKIIITDINEFRKY